MDMVLRNYVSVDLETTGLRPKYDKIIEIGAVKVENGQISGTWQSLVNPGRKLEEATVSLTGLTDGMLQNAPGIEEILPDFMKFSKDHVLLGHSLLFDYSFLKKAAVNAGYAFEAAGIDTLKLARRFLTGLESRTLGALCSYYGISHRAHRALDDALATHRLYEALCEGFFQEERQAFRPVPLICQVKKEQPAGRAQKERLRRLAQAHGVELDVDVERLSRSEASRLADRIVYQYGKIRSEKEKIETSFHLLDLSAR